LKLNFDGDIPNGAAGGGFVIQSSSGTVLAVGYTEVIASNVIEAELLGLWEEVKMGPRSFLIPGNGLRETRLLSSMFCYRTLYPTPSVAYRSTRMSV